MEFHALVQHERVEQPVWRCRPALCQVAGDAWIFRSVDLQQQRIVWSYRVDQPEGRFRVAIVARWTGNDRKVERSASLRRLRCNVGCCKGEEGIQSQSKQQRINRWSHCDHLVRDAVGTMPKLASFCNCKTWIAGPLATDLNAQDRVIWQRRKVSSMVGAKLERRLRGDARREPSSGSRSSDCYRQLPLDHALGLQLVEVALREAQPVPVDRHIVGAENGR